MEKVFSLLCLFIYCGKDRECHIRQGEQWTSRRWLKRNEVSEYPGGAEASDRGSEL